MYNDQSCKTLNAKCVGAYNRIAYTQLRKDKHYKLLIQF